MPVLGIGTAVMVNVLDRAMDCVLGTDLMNRSKSRPVPDGAVDNTVWTANSIAKDGKKQLELSAVTVLQSTMGLPANPGVAAAIDASTSVWQGVKETTVDNPLFPKDTAADLEEARKGKHDGSPKGTARK